MREFVAIREETRRWERRKKKKKRPVELKYT